MASKASARKAAKNAKKGSVSRASAASEARAPDQEITDKGFLDLVDKEAKLLSDDSSESLVVQFAEKINYLSNPPASSENLQQIAFALAPLFGLRKDISQEKENPGQEHVEVGDSAKPASTEETPGQALPKEGPKQSAPSEKATKTAHESLASKTTSTAGSESGSTREGEQLCKDLAREAEEQLELLRASNELRIHVLRAQLGQLWINKAVAKATRKMIAMKSLGTELDAWIKYAETTKLDFLVGEESVSAFLMLEDFKHGVNKNGSLEKIKYVQGQNLDALKFAVPE